METRVLLDKYIRKYYADWLRCSQRWCFMLGIANEAYDLFADVLLSLCQKPETILQEMIEHEEKGDRKLFFYVRKAIRLTIYNYRKWDARHFMPIDFLPDFESDSKEDEDADEIFDLFREVTAIIRADDFIDLDNPYMGHGWISRYVISTKSAHGRRAQVRYAVGSINGHQRQFCRRTSALAYLAGRNTPPRKSTIRTQ